MKRAAAALSLAAALFALPGFGTAASLDAARKLPVCGPAKATTLKAGGISRVYALGGEEPGVFGCLAGGQPRRLDIVPEQHYGFVYVDPRSIVLRAHWVVYFRWTVEVDIGDMSVGTTNLRTGRAWSCDLGPWSSSAETGLTIRGMVATETGTVGWVGERTEWPGFESPLLEFDEVATCRRSRFRRLERGGEIKLDSLRLEGQVMSWVSSGRLRSVRLP